MLMHLLVNASLLNSPATFQANVYRIHGLGRLLWVVEWFFIFLPLMFHAGLGVLIIRGSVPNVGNYPLCGQHPLHAAAGDRHHRVAVHRLARVSHARVVSL